MLLIAFPKLTSQILILSLILLNFTTLCSFEDCIEVLDPTGVQPITASGLSFDALCDMDTDGGGWTVIYQR